MSWFPQERKTCRGTVFASFWSPIFDVAPLVREAVAVKSDEQEDIEVLMEDLDEPPPNDSWLDERDEPLPPPLAPNHPRMDEVVALGARPMSYAHVKRREKRKQAKEQPGGQRPRPATLREHIRAERAIPTALDATELPAAHGAYAAKVEQDTWGSKKRRTLPELIGLGFRLISWDGFTSIPIVDVHGHIITVLVGQPSDPTYARSATRAFELLEMEQTNAHFTSSMAKHRRGGFVALNVGLLYCKGQTIPCRLNNSEHTALLGRLLADKDISRMATFASSSFALWAPKLHAYYDDYDRRLRQRLPHLARNWERSVFSQAAFNFGPSVWTFKHCDILNVAFGMCAVQALGDFNSRTGGHLILWELKLVIEFPPGAPHPTPVGHHHATLIFRWAPYTGGGLFRYVDNGFRTERELAEQDPEEYARVCEQKAGRWEMGLRLLSTVDELLESNA
ncbi:hypothetical protein MVEN_02582300 [Mycena venus]|uniref:Uncharacterized protein n=1 Tax=Mycena venus TaxID=2733690 RepID=A0A8H6U1G5_9AGAR|nr:hypothetical protein MVEN_02582300 [Mycena venus]